MAYTVESITTKGAEIFARLADHLQEGLTITGCYAVADEVTLSTALDSGNLLNTSAWQNTAWLHTDHIAMSGVTSDTQNNTSSLLVYAQFQTDVTSHGTVTDNLVRTFYLHGHINSDPTTEYILGVSSSNTQTRIPSQGDIVNILEIRFSLTFTPLDANSTLTVPSNNDYVLRSEYTTFVDNIADRVDKIADRVVTTHGVGTPTVGDDQTILGLKNFVGKVYISGSADVYSVFSIETTDGGSLQFRDAGEPYAEIKNDEDTGYLSCSVIPGFNFVIGGETFAKLSGEDDEIQISRPLIPNNDSGFDITLGNSGHSFVEGYIDEVYSPKLVGRTKAMQPGEVIYTFITQVIRGVGGMIDMHEDGEDQRIALKFSPNRNTGNPMLSVLSGGSQGTSQGNEIVRFSADGCTFAGNIQVGGMICPVTGETVINIFGGDSSSITGIKIDSNEINIGGTQHTHVITQYSIHPHTPNKGSVGTEAYPYLEVHANELYGVIPHCSSVNNEIKIGEICVLQADGMQVYRGDAIVASTNNKWKVKDSSASSFGLYISDLDGTGYYDVDTTEYNSNTVLFRCLTHAYANKPFLAIREK